MADMDQLAPGVVENGVTAEDVQEAPERVGKIGALWRNRDFMLLWSGQLISTLGSNASGIVFPLLMLAITGSPAAAGIAGALTMLPYAIFSLPAGALVDRWDRKRVMIWCDVGRAVLFVSIPVAMALQVLTVWQLYINAFLEGTLFVFFSIAEVSAVPQVVPREQLPNAAAQNQATFAVAGIVGPSIGTLLYQGVGRAAPFIADAVSYAVSVVSLLFIKTDFQQVRVPKEGRSSLRSEIMEGLRWLWAQPVIRFIAFAGAGLNLLFASMALSLILLAKNLGAPEGSIGLLFSIGAIGGIVGSVIAAPLQKKFRVGQILPATLWLVALMYPLFAVAPNFWALGLISAVIFIVGPVINVTTFSYRAALIPDELQGRVNSAFRMIAWGSQPIGALLGGLLLERAGVVPTVLVVSVGWLALAVLATANGGLREAR
ncbi:MAG: MFS transporter [Chloroflexia bacterium]